MQAAVGTPVNKGRKRGRGPEEPRPCEYRPLHACSTHIGGKRSFTDEGPLACEGVEACDYLFVPERDAPSLLLTPRRLALKSYHRTIFSAGPSPRSRGAACAYRLW